MDHTNPFYCVETLKGIIDTALYKLLIQISSDHNLNLNDMLTKYNIPEPSSHSKGKKKFRRKKPATDFVEMSEHIYENKTYLVDGENNVYVYDKNNKENAVLVGQKLINGTIKFINEQQ